MEVSAVDMSILAAEEANFDEIIILGIYNNDTQFRIHTSMDYQPDVYYSLQMAARLMLESGGKLND